jgi:hypothetical protein
VDQRICPVVVSYESSFGSALDMVNWRTLFAECGL